MIEYCPTYGALTATSAAPIHIVSNALAHAEIQQEQTLSRLPDATIVPLGIALQCIKTAGVELARANPHPKGCTLIGIRSELLEEFQVVAARIEGKQRSIDGEDLASVANSEVADSKEMYSRLAPLASRITAKKAAAEDFVKAMRAETDHSRARAAVLQMTNKRQSIRLGGQELVTGAGDSASEIELAARETYRLRMTVQSINTDTGEVTCKLVDGVDLDRLFDPSDLDRRVLHFRVVNEALFLLSQCGSLGAPVDVTVSLRMVLTPRGQSFRCTLVGFDDIKTLAVDLQKRLQNRYARLQDM